MSDLHNDGPTPARLVDLVVRLVRSDWPTTDAERIAWCTRYGLPIAGDLHPHRERDDLGQSFDAPDRPGFQFGWHTFRDEFVGVHWFCWSGLPREVVRDRADRLRKGLVAELGPAAEESGVETPHRQGFTAFWSIPRRSIEMYFHNGFHELPDGQLFDGPACVQVAVDHAQRAQACDDEAQERQVRSSR